MTVEYQLEPADFLAIAEERRRLAPDSLPRLYYYVILPALGVGLAVSTQSVAIATTFTLLFIASGWVIQRAYRRSVYSEENLSLTARRWTASLTEDGIRIASDAADILYRWRFVRRVFRGSRYVLFEFTPLQQVHIPIRAFRDEQHIQEFVTAANSHIKPLA